MGDEHAFDVEMEEEEPVPSAVFEVGFRDVLERLSGEAFDCFVNKVLGRLTAHEIAALTCTCTYWSRAIADPNEVFDKSVYDVESQKDLHFEEAIAKGSRVAALWKHVITTLVAKRKKETLQIMAKPFRVSARWKYVITTLVAKSKKDAMYRAVCVRDHARRTPWNANVYSKGIRW